MTKPSLLARQALNPVAPCYDALYLPARLFFLCENHERLTGNINFQDNLLNVLLTRERAFKQRLLAQAALSDGIEVLDLACGTGTLAVWAKQRTPGANLVGLDGDARMLGKARAKAARARVEIQFNQGLSFDLPYPDDRFDRVVTSLFFHHLCDRDKERTISEIARVLRERTPIVCFVTGRPPLHDGRWGKATMEASHHEEYLGRWLSKNLAGVALSVNADIPSDIDVAFIDEVDEHAGPIGGKGIGELGATGVDAAVADAVFHATGRRIRELPITPDKLV